MKILPHRARPETAGFTLLEMMIALGIFILLAGAVFGIITGVLTSASGLRDNQNRRDQIAALNAFLKKKLGELPAGSSVVSYRRGDGEGLEQNGIILGQNDEAEAIDAKIQGNGYYSLRLAFASAADPAFSQGQGGAFLPRFIGMVKSDDSTLTWTPLIRDIKTVSWKFQELNATQWVDQWPGLGSKPNLVEFSLQIAGDLQPSAMDFWLPQIAPASVILPTQAGGASQSGNTPSPTNGTQPINGSQPTNGSQSNNGAQPIIVPTPITVAPPHATSLP